MGYIPVYPIISTVRFKVTFKSYFISIVKAILDKITSTQFSKMVAVVAA